VPFPQPSAVIFSNPDPAVDVIYQPVGNGPAVPIELKVSVNPELLKEVPGRSTSSTDTDAVPLK
jgi:hypothetical protein